MTPQVRAHLRRILRPANRVALDRWVAEHGSRLTGMVLNAGCGDDGRRFGRRTIRLDAYAPGANVRADLASGLPFADMAFDGVVCTEVIEHVADHRLLLSELARVLKPNGRFVVSVPFVFHYHLDPVDIVRLTPAGLRAEMERAGFDVEYAGGLGNKLVALLLLAESVNIVSKVLTRAVVIGLAPLIGRTRPRQEWSDWAANAVAIGRKRA